MLCADIHNCCVQTVRPDALVHVTRFPYFIIYFSSTAAKKKLVTVRMNCNGDIRFGCSSESKGWMAVARWRLTVGLRLLLTLSDIYADAVADT